MPTSADIEKTAAALLAPSAAPGKLTPNPSKLPPQAVPMDLVAPPAPSGESPIGLLTPPPKQEVQQVYGRDTGARAMAADVALKPEIETAAARMMLPAADIPSVQEQVEALEPAWYESVFLGFEAFDAPRRAAWLTVAEASRALPDPGDDLTGEVGEAAQWLAGKATMLGAIAAPGVLPALVSGEGGDYAELYDQVGQRLYESLATGQVAERAEAYKRPWMIAEGTRAPTVRGTYLLDAAIPKSEAARIAASTPNPALRAQMDVLSSDIGRELWGASLEMVLDPLLLLGPAKGAQLAHVGGEAYHVAEPLVRAAGALERLAPDEVAGAGDALRTVASAVEGVLSDAEKALEARRALQEGATAAEEMGKKAALEAELAGQAAKAGGQDAVHRATLALTQQQRELARLAESAKAAGKDAAAGRYAQNMGRLADEAEKLKADPKAAVDFLTGYAKRQAAAAKAWTNDAETLRTGLRLAQAGKKGVVSSGTLAWHVPFGSQVRHVFKPGTAEWVSKVVNDAMPTPLLRAVDDFKRAAEPYQIDKIQETISAAVAAGQTEVAAMAALSQGQRMALTAQVVGQQAANVPRLAWTLLAQTFGSRFIQPMMAEITAAQFGTRGATFGRVPLAGRWFQVRKADPETWERYQGALSRFFARANELEGKLTTDVQRLVKSAKAAHSLRRRLARMGPIKAAEALGRKVSEEELLRWASDDYTVESVLTEVGALVEQGAGIAQVRPELLPHFRQVQEMVEEIRREFGQDYSVVANAVANLARHARGDEAAWRQAVREMQGIEESVSAERLRIDGEVANVQRAASEVLARIDALERGIARIGMGDIVRALELTRARLSHQPVEQVQYAHVRRVLLEAVGGDEQVVDDILKTAALHVGNRNVAKALLQLASVPEVEKILQASDTLRAAAAGGKAPSTGLPPTAALDEAIRDYLGRLKSQRAAAEEVFREGIGGRAVTINGQVLSHGMTGAAFEALMESLLWERMTAAKATVGEAAWMDFRKWMRAGEPTEGMHHVTLARWKRAAADWRRAQHLHDMLYKADEMLGSVPGEVTIKVSKVLAPGNIPKVVRRPGKRVLRKPEEVVEEVPVKEWWINDDVQKLLSDAQEDIIDSIRTDQASVSLTELSARLGRSEKQIQKSIRDLNTKAGREILSMEIAPGEGEEPLVALAKDAYKIVTTQQQVRRTVGVAGELDRRVMEALDKASSDVPKLYEGLGLAKDDRGKLMQAMTRLHEGGYIEQIPGGTPPLWKLTEKGLGLFEEEVERVVEKTAGQAGKAWRTVKRTRIEDVGGELAKERFVAGLEAERIQKIETGLEGLELTKAVFQDARLREAIYTAKTADEAKALLDGAVRNILGVRAADEVPHLRPPGATPPPASPRPDAILDMLVDRYTTVLAMELRVHGRSQDALVAARSVLQKIARSQAKHLGAEAAGREAAVARQYEDVAKMEGRLEELVEVRRRARPMLPKVPDADPENPDDWRRLSDFESELAVRFGEITKGLSERDRLLVSFAALEELPQVLPPEKIGPIAELYPSVMGQRFGQMPPELAAAAEDLREIVTRYEDLYEKFGFEFAKRPEEMLRMWGVVSYVPHLETERSLLARGGVLESVGKAAEMARAARGGKAARTGTGLERVLSLDMDASKRRLVEGTIAEINGMRNNSAMVLSLDPMAVLGRYLQANRAIGAKELFLMLTKGGVFRPVASEIASDGRILSAVEVAARDDLVPLFSRRFRGLEEEVVYGGSRADWERAFVEGLGLSRDQVAGMLRGAEEGELLFANWTKEIPELGTLRSTEQFYLDLRAAQFLRGQELADPRELVRVLVPKFGDGAWDQAAKMLNVQAVGLGVTGKVNGRMLQAYFGAAEDTEAWRLYVPRVIAQSMEDVLGVSGFEKIGGLIGMGRDALRWLNTFWKTRMTVVAIPFSTRNAISNSVSNILDLGAGGALNPDTNWKASILSQAAIWAEEYGSLERAGEVLSKGLDDLATAGMGAVQRDLAITKHAAARAAWAASPMPRWLKQGVDLGDGFVHTPDEALDLLRRHNVVSPAFTQFTDITTAERGILDAMTGARGPVAETIKGLSMAEDFLYVAWPAFMTGGIPVALPKNYGAGLARLVENQSRIANFIGNVKRGGSYEVASQHVQKFLFDYGDLNAVQKSVLRLIFPFFTWNAKNNELMMRLAQESPYKFSSFYRLFLEGGPRALKAWQDQEAGRAAVTYEPGGKREIGTQETHRLSQVRLPYPGIEHGYVVGLGLPQESWIEKIGLVLGFGDPANLGFGFRQYESRKRAMRLLGEVHFLLRAAVEWGTRHHSFYDRPISELTNGRLVAQSIASAAMIPVVGEPLRMALADAFGLSVVSDIDPRTHTFGEDPIIQGTGNWAFASLPWSRVLRDAAALTNLYAVSALATPGTGRDFEPLPTWLRVMDALTGVRVLQEDPQMNEALRLRRLAEARHKMLQERGVAEQFEQTYIQKTESRGQ